MQKIELDFHSKAYIWMDSNPGIIYSASEVLTKEVCTDLPRKSDRKQAALEILIPVGARFLYGLLGAEFIPNDSGKFSLEVLLSTNNASIFQQSIASELDLVRVGLPREYSQSVVEGALQSLNNKSLETLGCGVLQFNQAAHGEIGSSNKFFCQIAGTVVQLLTLNPVEDEKALAEIVKAYNFA